MLPFDPFEAAMQMNDQTALDSWARFESALRSTPVIAIHPSPYLQHDYPAAKDEYGPIQDIWQESIRQVVGIFEEAFAETAAPFSGNVTIVRESYVPPGAYAKGGPFRFPIELIQLAYEREWLLAIGAAVIKDLIVDATKESIRRLRRWWREHKVPENEQLLPTFSPIILLQS